MMLLSSCVQLEILEIQPSSAGKNDLAVSVDISPSCSIYSDERILQTYSAQVSERLQRYALNLVHVSNLFKAYVFTIDVVPYYSHVLCSMLIGASALDMDQFVILKDKYRWAVHVDLLVRPLFLLLCRCRNNN